jgi:hypothetical protein
MRFMLEIRIPTERANEVIKAGKFEQVLQSILGDLKPEAVYLSELEGCRGGWFVVNIDDTSQIPAIAEPFFIAFGAAIKFHPVMLPEDLMRGSEGFQAAVQKYS